MALSIFFLLLQIGFAITILYMCIAFVTGAPFVPSTNPVAGAMIRLAHIKKGDIVYDLGSGNGKLVLLAKKEGARAVGYEINPLLVLFSNIRGAPTRWKNFWRADIHDANIVFIYLLPWKMDALARKLKKDCPPGTRIVSNSFIFPNWKILRQDHTNHVYVFRV